MKCFGGNPTFRRNDFSQSDLEGDPFDVDEENEELAELDSLVERLQARNHNEALVRLAKDSGKKLFSHLDAVKRRNKISSMVCTYDFLNCGKKRNSPSARARSGAIHGS